MSIKSKRYLPGILLITAGFIVSLLYYLAFINFAPEYSLKHPMLMKLWIAGSEVHYFLKYMFGKSSTIFGFILIYTGYVILREISLFKKVLLGIIELSAFLTLLYFFSYVSKDLSRGGGLVGGFLTSVFKPVLPGWAVYVILITLLAGMAFILLKYPILTIKDSLIGKLIKNKVTKQDSIEKNSYSESERQESLKTLSKYSKKRERNKSGFKAIGSVFRSFRKKERRKPPFIRRVILDENGIPLEINNEIDYQYKAVIPQSIERENNGFLENKVKIKDEDVQLLLDDSVLFEDKNKQEEGLNVKDEWSPPKTSFLKKSQPINMKHLDREITKKAKDLERTLAEFGIEARVVNTIRGPVITRYELQPAPGVKLSRIVNLSDNIALSLSASGVRIEAPIPGQSAVGIEIPNTEREMVTLGDIIEKVDGVSAELPLILGKNISGRVVTADLANMPHLLIAGATGSGKSVCVNSLIVSLLYKKSPRQVRFLMIDPKMVELKIYNGIPHLLTEVVTDPKDAGKALRWVLREMEYRYRLLDEAVVRDIRGYNQKSKEKLPYIVIIVDEFANLMAISQKDVEDAVVRLAAMSRAVGIHLIMATQRPSVDVITGLIKANFPYRIAFQVASKTDSRTILDTIGAEKLLGRGDMLFSPAGAPAPIRIQGAYISENEVIRIVEELKKKTTPEYVEDIFGNESVEEEEYNGEDPIFNDAVEIVLRTKRASASFLQRRLRIGYNRAARLIELMEEKGIIGPPRGSKPREIFLED